MAKLDPQIIAHLEWIGFVQPTGLVVSAPALVRAGAILDRRDAEGQRLLRTCIEEREFEPNEGPAPWLPDFRTFASTVLNWSFSPKGYAGTDENPIPNELEVPLVDYGETLRPDFAVRELDPQNEHSPWQLLVRVLEPGQEFDRIVRGGGALEASAQGRMERLLRQTGVPAGLLSNGRALRLVSAPRGESSGWMDFRVADMVQTAGRPICTALRLLLDQPRLLALAHHQRLAALLEDSRKYQNEVSERLAEQVLHALYELLRGFQAAHDSSKGELLRQPLAEHPDEVYRALLTVILRLVFLLYSEERDMLPDDETFHRYYSLAGLYDRLREDAALFPDTMNQRYGAWAQLLVLFRMIHDGAELEALRLPQRHGVLFDPDRFKFLEGRPAIGARQIHERFEPPLVPDGTIYRALEKLLVLDGERISYRALDVEQIGSVYETMMGFRLETATGHSAAIKAAKKHGAPTTIDLEALLEESAAKRKKWIQDRADRKLTDRVHKAVKDAESLEDLHAALEPVLDKDATPDLVPTGAMILQPSEERRRSGSHYTPRSLTEPIVRTTLEPILARLRGENGRPPLPEQILDLKVCDPAMGSGAFLVESCRQLGDALIESWRVHDAVPEIPPDEDEVIFARRLIAQRCLYGVDRNPVAVDLAKVSLWLVTLAKEHALTFVDHALRHGDSLVGLSRKQIEAFHWDPNAPRFQAGFETMRVREQVAKVTELRTQIREAGEEVSDRNLRDLWDEAKFELGKARLFGDLVMAAFFEGTRPKEREVKRSEFANAVVSGETECYRGWLDEWRHADQPLAPFHWEIEFPEVFGRVNPGFDAIVGNPPFLGGKKISAVYGGCFRDWLPVRSAGTSKNADLVAHFFRVAFSIIRQQGCLGLIATNTIGQGDTRPSGLGYICRSDGKIYEATRRLKWPGQAAVVVSVVHVCRSQDTSPCILDGSEVERITAYLFYRGTSLEPHPLSENSRLAFVGYQLTGVGFTFDDKNSDCASLSEMQRLISQNPRNSELIFPYIGGSELYDSPTQEHRRYAINFGQRSKEQARQWPDLMAVLEKHVLPFRQGVNRERHRRYWWQYGEPRPGLLAAIDNLETVLLKTRTSDTFGFLMQDSRIVFAESTVILALNHWSAFSVVQSSSHERWARFFGTTFKDDLVYGNERCFETFPFPENWQTVPTLEAAGKAYYDFRAALMVNNDEGLTKTYNRFHDPEKRAPDIVKLRELHASMDRAVLDAYGWNDISTDCEFLLDYEIDEEEANSRRKKPWRYRWPNEVRDEVLARLLELNAERAKEEVRAGLTKTNKSSGKGRKKRATKSSSTGDLFS